MNRVFLLILFFTSIAFSQNHVGTVKDSLSKIPLEGVHISSEAIVSNTFSGANGAFSVIIKEGASNLDSISFTSVGYERTWISIADLRSSNFEVLLTPSTEQLREVNLLNPNPLKQSLKYKKLAEMKTAVYDFSSVVEGGKLYVIAGDASFLEDPVQDEVNKRMGMVSLEDIMRASWRNFSLHGYSDKIQIYNIEEDKWETAPFSIRKRAGHNAVLFDNKIYIIGGKNLQMAGKKEYIDDKVEILDLEKDTLLIDHVNPHQAIDAAAFTYQGNLMVLGGSVRVNKIGNKIFSDDVHMFNFDSGLWFNAGKMTAGRETVAVRVEDEVFLIGGRARDYVDSIEVLDLLTGLWEERAKLPFDLKDPAVTAHEEVIYIYEKGNFLTYNTRSGELQNFNIDLKVEGPGLEYANGKLYLMGGYEGNDFTQSPVKHTYSINLEEFATTAVIGYSRN